MKTVARDSFPDILRGFALLGIAMVNVQYFAIDTVAGFEGQDLSEPANGAAAFIVMLLFQSKFYLLFSFLFGYSAKYVIAGEKSNRPRWIWRSIGLILFGLVHLTFLFHGDILFVYGVFGLVLAMLYFRKESTLKLWAWLLYLSTAGLFTVFSLLTVVGEAVLASKGKVLPDDEFVSGLDSALAGGSFLEAAAARFELWTITAPQAFLLQGPLVFVAFLVGVLVSRKDGLAGGVNPERMKTFAFWGTAVGLPLQLVAAYLSITNAQAEQYSLGIFLASLTINFITAPILSAGYVGILWLLAQKLGDIKLLSAAGRHSLSIYIGQSIVFSVLFSAWGVGLFGELNGSLVALIAFATWVVLSLLAMLNLRWRARGPLESALTGFSKLFTAKK